MYKLVIYPYLLVPKIIFNDFYLGDIMILIYIFPFNSVRFKVILTDFDDISGYILDLERICAVLGGDFECYC